MGDLSKAVKEIKKSKRVTREKLQLTKFAMAKTMTISGIIILLGWFTYVLADMTLRLISGINFEIPSEFGEVFKHLAIIAIGLVLTFVGYSKLRNCEEDEYPRE